MNTIIFLYTTQIAQNVLLFQKHLGIPAIFYVVYSVTNIIVTAMFYYMTPCHNQQVLIIAKYYQVIFLNNNNLKKLRNEKGLTQIALQMNTGIEQALISKYERGERVPPTETVMLLADFFDVSTDYILGRTNNPKVNK